MNHLGDTNKMVDETPRTNQVSIRPQYGDEWDWCRADFARQLERELNAANECIKRLEDWKESALEIEREWDANSIATMLGGKLGESHRKVIQREVPKLLARIKRLEEAGDEMASRFIPIGKSDRDALEVWNKAKEAKL